MFEDLKKAITEFKKAKSVALFVANLNTVDKASSIIALAKICSKEKKNFQIICPLQPRVPVKRMFEKEGLEITSTPFSKDYIVSVDYSSANIEKVICKRDEESKKLNFVITPKDEIFNFDNVELISGGNSFDLVFSFGLNDLENVKKDFRDILEGQNVISLTRTQVDFAKYKFLINGKKSYSEVTYEFVKAFSSNLTEEILNILLKGVISKYKLLENGDNDGWLIVTKFLKYGADFNKAFRGLNYSKDLENLQLQRKVMENIRIDKANRVIWSKVAVMMDVDSKNLDVRGRIVFNICEDFDLAFVIYHLDRETIKVVLESNDIEKYSAIDLAKKFSGYGTASRAIFTNKGIEAENFEAEFFKAINDAFEIKIV